MKITAIRIPFSGLALALIVVVGVIPNATEAANLPKVQVCHIPPGDPANFHTISISENALPAHLAHGDPIGACDASCAVLCDDGNACTIDDTGDCETNGCPSPHPPVDCDDGDLCTTDTCDPTSGCINAPVTCTAPDACTVSVCSPATGGCVETPVVCPAGTACNPGNGLCEDITNPDPECAGRTCGTFTTCNDGGSCGPDGVCGSTSAGGGVCVNGSTLCADLARCFGGQSDCAAGSVCFVDSCCADPVCVPSSQFCSNPLNGPTSVKVLLMTPGKSPGATIGRAKE